MTQQAEYHIGTPGKAWGNSEKAVWLAEQNKKRSYADDVVSQIDPLRTEFDVEQYGTLDYAAGQYPLFVIKTKMFSPEKPTILVTGGVHGYETSGVHGALHFAANNAKDYAPLFNIVVAPCISPWGYETINRWNPEAVDPNRSFVANSPAPEAANIMAYVATLGINIFAHIDLHETTDTDNSEFRPALAARDDSVQDNWNIPDGFYTVGDSHNPNPEFQSAVIASVEQITHIALADETGKLIGSDLAQHGVINYPLHELGLCAGFTYAQFTTTTEVYPDSPSATAKQCIAAQVAAVVGALDHLKAQLPG
ncbi:MAG: hypothetical protein ACI9C4_000650 [Paraglaciecola sp.]|jgi:hypothetical protein